jgi:hypothetical protein
MESEASISSFLYFLVFSWVEGWQSWNKGLVVSR